MILSRLFLSFNTISKSKYLLSFINKKKSQRNIKENMKHSELKEKHNNWDITSINSIEHFINQNKKSITPFGHQILNKNQFAFNLILFFSQSYSKNNQQSQILFYSLSKKYFNGQNNNNLGYIQEFVKVFLPSLISEQVQSTYLICGIEYLNKIKCNKKFEQKDQFQVKFQLSVIQTNLTNFIFNLKRQLYEDEGEKQYLLHRTLFQTYLQLYTSKIHLFDSKTKLTNIKLSKFLKVFNPEFLQIVKEDLQTKSANYSTSTYLQILAYLTQSKNLPYQYFYKNKNQILSIIRFSQNYSYKKINCCIRFLQIFSKQFFAHCQVILCQLLQMIQTNLDSMEGHQLVRVLYLYSKIRYTPKVSFIAILVQKLYFWIAQLDQRHLCLIVRSLSNLNYKNQNLIAKLKQINYQLFITQLKFGDQNLGQHYRLILAELQQKISVQNRFQTIY